MCLCWEVKYWNMVLLEYRCVFSSQLPSFGELSLPTPYGTSYVNSVPLRSDGKMGLKEIYLGEMPMRENAEGAGRGWESCQTWILPGLPHTPTEPTDWLRAAWRKRVLWASLATDSQIRALQSGIWEAHSPCLHNQSERRTCQPTHSYHKGSETKWVNDIYPFRNFHFQGENPQQT